MKFNYLTCLCLAAALLLCRSSVAQSNLNGQLPVSTYARPYLMLIRDPQVHADLGLSPQQQREIEALNDELAGPLWSMRNKSAEHVAKTMQQSTETAQSRLSSILSSQQQQRLKQIQWWTLGMKAFARDEVARELGISEDQKKSIIEVLTKTQQEINELNKQLRAGQSQNSLAKKARSFRIDEQKKILAILSRKQQQQWFQLLGKRIDISQLGRVRFKAPEIVGREGWINSPPLAIEQLKGKVIALHFYAFG